MTRREWARRMAGLAIALLVVGLALTITGSLFVGRNKQAPMAGVAIGLFGVLLLTAGGLFGKFAIAGPYPDRLEAE